MNALDDLAHATHAAFIADRPGTALFLREMLENGVDRADILDHYTSFPMPSETIAAIEGELDYLIATNAAGRTLQTAMTTDMPEAPCPR